jgi:hypothetical protein
VKIPSVFRPTTARCMGLRVITASLFAAVLLGTSPITASQSDLGPPKSIVAGLQSEDKRAQATIANLLLLSNVAPTQDFRDCDLRADTLDERAEYSTLQIKCGDGVNLVVLRSHGSLSEVLSSRYIDAASVGWRVAFVSLISPSTKEIVIHNADSDGAGHESYFLVLALAGKELNIVFSAPENSDADRWRSDSYSEERVFTTSPATESRRGGISESATVRIGGLEYTIRRSFGWSDNLKLFVEVGLPTIQLKKSK